MEDFAMDNRRQAIAELVKGREFANQLRQIIKENRDINIESATTATPFAQNLAKNVLNSFTNTLFLLFNKYPLFLLFNKYPTYEDQFHDEVISQIQTHASSYNDSLLSPTKSEDSQQSCKSRRGCHKRRRTIQSMENVSESPTDDGRQWRKYGQKVILNSKYTRNYYRCTHKYDQKCQATKQVQQVQEKPPLYKTTYHGHHTCKNLLLNPEIILEDSTYNADSDSNNSIFLSFDNTFPNPTKQAECPFLFSSSSSPSIKDCNNNKKELLQVPSSNSSNDDYNYMLSDPQPTLDNFPKKNVTLSSILESDLWDVMLSSFLHGSVDHAS